MASPVTHAKCRVASLSRKCGPDSDQVADARRDLAEANIAAAIERNLSRAPKLTDDQIARLSALLA
ncbi:hypothetical protein LH935_16345 [Gordonia polyisoprenivorans]|uniref:hypothetical protein n=1 Tax=Gordonia polyisoprenivorans TaxID=84595 RepID=UPI0022342087|nr:hypothetical protein LH935_16345 [Gordonia polyisoprenivorans]